MRNHSMRNMRQPDWRERSSNKTPDSSDMRHTIVHGPCNTEAWHETNSTSEKGKVEAGGLLKAGHYGFGNWASLQMEQVFLCQIFSLATAGWVQNKLVLVPSGQTGLEDWEGLTLLIWQLGLLMNETYHNWSTFVGCLVLQSPKGKQPWMGLLTHIGCIDGWVDGWMVKDGWIGTLDEGALFWGHLI